VKTALQLLLASSLLSACLTEDVPECRLNSDCATGEMCQAEECVAAQTPPTTPSAQKKKCGEYTLQLGCWPAPYGAYDGQQRSTDVCESGVDVLVVNYSYLCSPAPTYAWGRVCGC